VNSPSAKRSDGSIHCLFADVSPRGVRALRRLLLECCPLGFEERPKKPGCRFVVYAESKARLRDLEETLSEAVSAMTGLAEVELSSASKKTDWQSGWVRHLGPQQLSPGFTVIPVASAAKEHKRGARESRPLYLLRRAAFGFGEHSTTRLVASELQGILTKKAEQSVLDVGTGTGVLAILAALCGAPRAVGVDIDAASIRAARANARLNRVSRRCHFAHRSLVASPERFDVVLANLDVPTLERLAEPLVRALSDPGTLVLSGVLAECQDQVNTMFQAYGLRLGRVRREGEWLALQYHR